MATPPRIATIVQTPVLTWADGISLFNGYLLVELVPASDGSTAWVESDLGGFSQGQTLPRFSVLPIINGVFNTSVGLWYTLDLSPPGSKYQSWLYDSTNRQLTTASSLFQVTSSPYNPALSAPTNPTTTATPISPDA